MERSKAEQLAEIIKQRNFKHREHPSTGLRAGRAEVEDREGGLYLTSTVRGKNFSPEIRTVPEFSSFVIQYKKLLLLPTRTEIQG